MILLRSSKYTVLENCRFPKSKEAGSGHHKFLLRIIRGIILQSIWLTLNSAQLDIYCRNLHLVCIVKLRSTVGQARIDFSIFTLFCL